MNLEWIDRALNPLNEDRPERLGRQQERPERLMILGKMKRKKLKRRALYLIAEPRSGSSWLMHTLNSHPKIRMHYELLNPEGFPRALKFKGASSDLFAECFAYLEEKSFRSRHPWSGCKILVPHLFQVSPEFPEYFVSRIQEMGGRCIFLIRRDLLAARLSLYIASKTGRWHLNRAAERQETPIRMDPDAVWRGLDRAWSWRKDILNILNSRGVDFLQISYEALFPGPEASLRRIAEFLNVKSRGFTQNDEVKSNPFRMDRILINYSEVLDRLRKDERFGDLLPGTEDAEVPE